MSTDQKLTTQEPAIDQNLTDQNLTAQTTTEQISTGYHNQTGQKVTGRTKPGPKYISITRIIELADRGLSHSEIASIVGCHKSNVTRRLQTVGYQTQRVKDYIDTRADLLAHYQARILHSLSDADLKKASALQKVTAYGILYDKERLERDKSTTNVALYTQVIERWGSK